MIDKRIDDLAYKAFHAAHEAYNINKIKAVLYTVAAESLEFATSLRGKKALKEAAQAFERSARNEVERLPS